MMDIPAVFIDTYAEDASLTTVSIEDRKGGYLAAKYFLDMGHRQVAFVSTPTEYPGVMQERYRGFCDAFLERGTELEPDHLMITDNVSSPADTPRRNAPSIFQVARSDKTSKLCSFRRRLVLACYNKDRRTAAELNGEGCYEFENHCKNGRV